MNADDIKTVAVVGAGTMGPGIAATFARHGFATRLFDIKPEQLEKAKGTVDFVYATLVRGGFMTDAEAEKGKKNLTYTGDLGQAVGGADFVVETAPEKLEIKQQVFRDVEGLVGDDAILASNTSGIPITTLASVCKHPERVIGMHWSNPPHVIPVIEVIRGEQTDQATVDTTFAVVRRIGMIPAAVDRDVAGFVENRILYAIMREALHLLDEGVASAEAIDTVVKWGIGYKLAVIGPLELLDMAGLDIYTSVANYLNPDLSNRADVSPTVTSKVAAGRLGIKTQGGLFDYTPEQIQQLAQRRGKLLLASKKALMQD
ncbi:MAG TPA: 3-hydroxyacyl-CoA dehydrogenase NAD-binding domain-containing protein [Thermomicrobiales bacterium]|nr:3-hydroxyacyl-CoA dehydrogenase NAD-binding domain-containing protein [Thermomicrobiales bacterium]